LENNTYIVGKDASLENSISRMQQQLEKLGFHIEEHSWLNPLPHVWSVHIRDRDCPLLFTNGKGASKKAALASALGEFFERLATNYFWADYYLGEEIAADNFVHYRNERWFEIKNNTQWPEDLLTHELIQFYDPDNELQLSDWVDINSANKKRGVCTLPYIRQRDQKEIWFPVNIIGNLYVSNGMSAGNSANEARVQALSEIFERHVKFKIIEESICLPDIPQAVIDEYPSIKEGIEKLQEKGFGVLLKDASLGGKYPVINVTLLNPENQGCFASFGAHPRFEVALERSLTELLQGRELNTLNQFPAPSHDTDEVASQENLETHFIDSSGLISWQFLKDKADIEFCKCDFIGTTEEEFDWLCELIHDSGRDIYISDYDHLGVYACRVLVPSMSEIYPVDDLIWANNNSGISIRDSILKIATLSAQEADALLKILESTEIDDLQPVAALLGIPPQKGTIWEDYRVAELKVLLAAISENRQQLLQGCEWLLGFGQINQSRQQLYHCVWNILVENMDDYNQTFTQLYPDSIIKQANSLVSGRLDGFVFENQQSSLLVQAYNKLHLVK
jgi:ribosomal protein S12 methylthiotransferase accessory factor